MANRLVFWAKALIDPVCPRSSRQRRRFLELSGLGVTILELSPSLHGENAPLYPLDQILILASQGISSTLGLAGAILSKTNVRRGGIVMVVAAVIAFASLSGLFSGGLFFLLLVPVYGWWTVVLLLGGLFGAMARIP